MGLSQYVADYLEGNAQRGLGFGLTISTYLAGRLRGKSRQYAGRYRASLERSCRLLGAVPGPSARGSIAYYPQESEVTA